MVTVEDRVTDLLLDEAAPVTSRGRAVEVGVRTGLALSDLGRGEEAGVGQGQRGGLGAAHRPQLAVTRGRGVVAGGGEVTSAILQQRGRGGAQGADKVSIGRGHTPRAPRRTPVAGDGVRGSLVLLHRGDPRRHNLEHGAIGGQERGHLCVRGLHLAAVGLVLVVIVMAGQIIVNVVQDLSLFFLQHKILQLVLDITLFGRNSGL